MPAPTMGEPLVCVGVIAGPHGVRGQVKVRSFTATPGDVAAYGPVRDESGTRRFTLRLHGAPKEGVVVASLAGIADRDAAEALKGLRLYVARSALPTAAEDEFYHADLVGLRAEGMAGETVGTVQAVQNFGAGDVLEVAKAAGGDTLLVPFTKAAVPLVDVGGGRVVIDLAVADAPADPEAAR